MAQGKHDGLGFTLIFVGVLCAAGIIGGYRSWGGPRYGGGAPTGEELLSWGMTIGLFEQ